MPRTARKRIRSAQPLQDDGGWSEICLRGVDVGLAGMILLLPFVLGGRFGPGPLLLVILACGTSFLWCLHQAFRPQADWVRMRFAPLLLLPVLLLLLQTAALPADALQWLSPHLAEWLPLWQQADGAPFSLGHWSTVSLTPAETRQALMTLLCYVLIFVVAYQRMRRVEDFERLLRWMCLAAATMAVFALAQCFAGNGKFFWFYDYPLTDAGSVPKGAFTNRNHLAHFLTLSLGPFLWWILRALEARSKRGQWSFASSGSPATRMGGDWLLGLLVIGLGVVVFTVLLSLSRGGIVAMCLSGLLLLGLAWRSGLLGGRLLLGLGGAAGLVSLCLGVYGDALVEARLNNLLSGDLERIDGSGARRLIWLANSRAFSEAPWVGAGAGSHRHVYPRFMKEIATHPDSAVYEHAESGYLEIATEAGTAGLLLVLAALMTAFFWCWRSLRSEHLAGHRACAIAAAGGIAATALHSVVDFVWFVPACVTVVLLLAAGVARLPQLGATHKSLAGTHETADASLRHVPRAAWMLAAVGVLLLGGWMGTARWHRMQSETHWLDYVRAVKTPVEEGETIGLLKQKIAALSAAVKADPTNVRAHLSLARRYRSLFNIAQSRSQNALTLDQIRDAALNGGFASQQERDEWLTRVLGPNRRILEAVLVHTRQALKLCPLLGEGYVFLAELAFLEGASQQTERELISQALAVRPYSAEVLFAAGRQYWWVASREQMAATTALAEGHATEAKSHAERAKQALETALSYWNESYRRSPVFRRRITQTLVDAVSAEWFLSSFEVDLPTLRQLADRYRETGRESDLATTLKTLSERAVAQAEKTTGDEAVSAWLDAARAFDELKQPEQAGRCLERALREGPESYAARSAAGEWLLRNGRYAQAREHLQWCARRKPEDGRIRWLLETAAEKALQGPSSPQLSDDAARHPRL